MRGFGLQAAVPGRANLDYGGLERDLEPDVLILRGRVGACENKDCLVMCEEKGTVRVRESFSRQYHKDEESKPGGSFSQKEKRCLHPRVLEVARRGAGEVEQVHRTGNRNC